VAIPDTKYLRELLGDAWVDSEVFGDKPKHLLGRWHKKDPDNICVRHTEDLVKSILTTDNVTLDRVVLANKIKSLRDFIPTLAEMETATYLRGQGFAVTFEPTAPHRGPDLRVELGGIPYFVEVRTVGFSEEENRRDLVCKEIFATLDKTPSSYRVTLTVGDEYKSSTPQIREAISALLTSLDHLKDKKPKSASLYFVRKNEGVLALAGTSLSETHHKIVDAATFVAQFENTGAESEKTSAMFLEKMKNPPEPSRDHERLRQILDDKRDQLPKDSRGIIVLEVSKLFMLSDFSIDRALYGDTLVRLQLDGPEGTVGEALTRRNTRGFLLHTSRVSAVLIQKRTVQRDSVMNEWHVYPTNRANEDTIRLSLAELKRFGDVGDRKTLSSEHLNEGK
jgi:hypothetical protein